MSNEIIICFSAVCISHGYRTDELGWARGCPAAGTCTHAPSSPEPFKALSPSPCLPADTPCSDFAQRACACITKNRKCCQIFQLQRNPFLSVLCSQRDVAGFEFHSSMGLKSPRVCK